MRTYRAFSTLKKTDAMNLCISRWLDTFFRPSAETSKFRTQMTVRGSKIFRASKKLENVSVSQLLTFSAQPIKASLVQLASDASKHAVEMFQLVMK